MTKKIEAVYEQGMIRPLQRLELPEGTRLVLFVVSKQGTTNGKAAEILAEIAALPVEGASETFAGAEHDTILYPSKSG